jgi:hypothetical protein
LIFCTKKLHFVQIFVQKHGIFHPAGGEMTFWVSNCVTPVIDRLLLEKISLAGIARAVQVAERWLQAYFNENYDNVPREVARVGVCLTVV